MALGLCTVVLLLILRPLRNDRRREARSLCCGCSAPREARRGIYALPRLSGAPAPAAGLDRGVRRSRRVRRRAASPWRAGARRCPGSGDRIRRPALAPDGHAGARGGGAGGGRRGADPDRSPGVPRGIPPQRPRACCQVARTAVALRQEGAAGVRDELARRGAAAPIVPGAFVVADAADLDLPEGSIDLIYSEDVFEHIERGSLERVVEKMAGWLTPTGLAPGAPERLHGDHGRAPGGVVPESFAKPGGRRSEPWEHLRARRRHANTYLNELTRADYRALFSRGFEVLEEVVRLPDLGREFMTPEIAAELSAFGDDELFSNQVCSPPPTSARSVTGRLVVEPHVPAPDEIAVGGAAIGETRPEPAVLVVGELLPDAAVLRDGCLVVPRSSR